MLWTILVILLVLWLIGLLSNVGGSLIHLLLVVAVSLGTVLSSTLKLLVARPRPDLIAHVVQVHTMSFPSGHATLSAVTYLTLGALLARVQPNRRLKAFLLGLALILTILVGASRVYLGVHWPSDVLAGWCVGAAWASLCWFVALQLQRRGQGETGHEPAEPSR